LVQLALPPAGTEQAEHAAPQEAVDALSEQTLPQRW